MTAELESLDRQLTQVMDERDNAEEQADALADCIAGLLGIEIGEHSSGNAPWQNAIDAAEYELDKRKRLAPEPPAIPADLRELVDRQAEDVGLWSVPLAGTQSIAEAYLQKELRRLHAKIESYAVEPRENLVAGDALATTLWQFEARANSLLTAEQVKPLPDMALIGFLCDAVTLSRENERLAKSPIEPPDDGGLRIAAVNLLAAFAPIDWSYVFAAPGNRPSTAERVTEAIAWLDRAVGAREALDKRPLTKDGKQV